MSNIKLFKRWLLAWLFSLVVTTSLTIFKHRLNFIPTFKSINRLL
jgi:hypothetical protein